MVTALILSMQRQARLFATFLNVPVLVSTQAAFVRWVRKSVVVKRSTLAVSPSTNTSKPQ
ncbi:Uncharacterised protein [Vibrio cholerae]|nr:Uncharacterised protein [Vibrio cholerae]